MVALPLQVCNAWDVRQDAVVFSTADINGVPNSIYVRSVFRYSESIIVIADNYFDKTRRNLLTGSKACILFITNEGKSYQLKGSVRYLKSGESYDNMKKWNPSKHPGHAAACLEVEEVYSGSERIA